MEYDGMWWNMLEYAGMRWNVMEYNPVGYKAGTLALSLQALKMKFPRPTMKFEGE